MDLKKQSNINENTDFKLLPFFVQENIVQSGIKIDSAEHLKQIAKNLIDR